MSIANLNLTGYAVGPAYFQQVDARDGSGKKLDLAVFKIAHNPRSKADKDKAIFIRVSCWGMQAVIARDRIQKGSPVSVTGSLSSVEVAMEKGTSNPVRDSKGNIVINVEMTARDLEVPVMGGTSSTNESGDPSWSEGNTSSNASNILAEMGAEGLDSPF